MGNLKVFTIFNSKNIGISAIWFIAIGALVIAVSLIFGSDESHIALIHKAPFSKLRDRLWFSVAVSGATLSFAGSLLLSIKYWSLSVILIPITIVGYLVFHFTAAWKLWQYYKTKKNSEDNTTQTQNNNEHNWLWCVCNPYNKDDEPISRIKEYL